MKKGLLVVLSLWLVASGCKAEGKLELKEQKDKVSYIIGLQIGEDFKQKGIEVDPKVLAEGIRTAMAGEESLLSDEEIQATMTAFQTEMQAKQQQMIQELAEKNLKEGEAFLAANKAKEGVKTTESGLQYKVITSGKGKQPKATDEVTVNYKGTLIDGTEFDSSYRRGQPATFPVKGVIPGWTEALQLMKEGAKWELYIPAKLAYGERGAGQMIGPNATLIFEVELIKVN